MKILILGPTGTGKSTQAKFIAKVFKLKHIETGKIFRRLAKRNKFIKRILEEGKLVPDKITLDLVYKLIKNKKNFILDGFPRRLSQAKAFKEDIDLVLFLKTTKKEAIKRLILRGRPDDTPDNVVKRYDVYLKRTLPVVRYYKKMGILVTINGGPPIKKVWENIKRVLIKYNKNNLRLKSI